ncbi:MAG TPA: type I-F CRISPR-associated protein Csy2 [Vicinamibacterales bacterium]|jgi:CRISPR-associated protein Csy2
MSTDYQEAVLIVPRLKVRGANAVSSQMTWGFPSITAFTGLMTALARRRAGEGAVEFRGIGVVCHDCEPQTTEGGYTRAFRLTRNPVDKKGDTAAIVEEGRIHLDVTLVFLVNLATTHVGEGARQRIAQETSRLLHDMRIAGGSLLPSAPDEGRRAQRPSLHVLPDTSDDRRAQFRTMTRRWLPGFTLVDRRDLLDAHLATLCQTTPGTRLLDAWLDLSRLNHRAIRAPDGTVEWVTDRREGWTVPIPVGYAGLSQLYRSGEVANARDATTPFRFVESVYSIGQWISPHRLTDVVDLVWYTSYDPADGLYRCCNDYSVSTSAADAAAIR